MFKLIFIAVIAMMFSGCVGTLVKNEATTKSDIRVTKGVKGKVKVVNDKKIIKKVRDIK